MNCGAVYFKCTKCGKLIKMASSVAECYTWNIGSDMENFGGLHVCNESDNEYGFLVPYSWVIDKDKAKLKTQKIGDELVVKAISAKVKDDNK